MADEETHVVIYRAETGGPGTKYPVRSRLSGEFYRGSKKSCDQVATETRRKRLAARREPFAVRRQIMLASGYEITLEGAEIVVVTVEEWDLARKKSESIADPHWQVREYFRPDVERLAVNLRRNQS